jgi:hypothetical protein
VTRSARDSDGRPPESESRTASLSLSLPTRPVTVTPGHASESAAGDHGPGGHDPATVSHSGWLAHPSHGPRRGSGESPEPGGPAAPRRAGMTRIRAEPGDRRQTG